MLTVYCKDVGLWAYTLRSVTMSGHVKYKRNSLACKMQEDNACNTGNSACINTHHPLKIMASGHLKIKKETRPELILATRRHTTEGVHWYQ